MKIIVCGAGPVGTGIARQLASEDNNVIVIDSSPEQIQRLNEYLDVSAVVGFPSYPDVLEDAGAANTEMIIAVTTSDEVNMIICQVAHSVFNIPIKIARIRNKSYLDAAWKDLYRHDHLPIDFIISPEKEVAKAIINRLHVPGAMNSIPFVNGRLKAIEVRCTGNCPSAGSSISSIKEEYPHLKMSVLGINRGGQLIVPQNGEEKILGGDELFFVADSEYVQEIMTIFGHEEKEARRVVIIGGGNIGFFIAEELENEKHGSINAKLIELNKERAEYIASRLPSTRVINGNSLDQEILFESNIESTETVIAVTNDDEVNILSCLLAKRFGTQRAFALVNKGRSYNPLVTSLGIDVTINPREMTVSSILQHTRKGKVSAAHSICGGKAEVIENEIVHHSTAIGMNINDLELPASVKIGAIFRDNEIIIPDDKTVIAEKDHVIILALISQIRKVDKIFSARLDYF